MFAFSPSLAWVVGVVLVAVMGRVLWRARQRVRLLARFAHALGEAAPLPALPSPLAGELGRLQLALERTAGAVAHRLESMRGEERRAQAVLGGMVEGVLVIDATGAVLLSNQRAEELLELPPGELHVGRPLIELTRHPDVHALVRRVMAEGGLERSLRQEVALDAARQHVLQVTATSLREAPGASGAFILVLHDISDLKHLERMRRDFVANVSHELRTPLAAISGYAETLLGGALGDPERARQFLGIIERHAQRLGRLVEDLLTLSDLELGRAALQRESIRVEPVVDAAFETLRQKAAAAGVALERVISPETPWLDADPDRLEQALVNLLDNAIKYTPEGGRVTVSTRTVRGAEVLAALPQAEGAEFVEIAVADTGIGVPSEDLPRLTERFYRVDKARSRELGGTGLGLAIVKHIVQAHGGWMRIESQLGRGTTVRLCVPRAGERTAAPL